MKYAQKIQKSDQPAADCSIFPAKEDVESICICNTWQK